MLLRELRRLVLELGSQRRGEHARPGGRDSELLAQDVHLPFAEELDVVQADAGQHRELRDEHTRRVEPAADARLEDRHLDTRC